MTTVNKKIKSFKASAFRNGEFIDVSSDDVLV